MRAASSGIRSSPSGMPPLLSMLSRMPRAPSASSAATSSSVKSMVSATTARARPGVRRFNDAMPSMIAALSTP